MGKATATPAKVRQQQQNAAAIAAGQLDGFAATLAARKAEREAKRRELAAQLAAVQGETDYEFARQTVDQTKAALAQHIEGSRDSVLKGLWADFQGASDYLASHAPHSAKAARRANGPTGGRLNAESKAALADAIISALRAAGADGLTATALADTLAAAGQPLGGRNPREIADGYDGHKIASEGRGPGTVYRLAK